MSAGESGPQGPSDSSSGSVNEPTDAAADLPAHDGEDPPADDPTPSVAELPAGPPAGAPAEPPAYGPANPTAEPPAYGPANPTAEPPAYGPAGGGDDGPQIELRAPVLPAPPTPPHPPARPAAPVIDAAMLLRAHAAEWRDRLIGPLARSRLAGWIGPLLVTVLAGVMRFVHLGVPHRLVFDETYYVKDAFSFLKFGYEGTWPENPNPAFQAGDFSGLSPAAEYVVHPPVGKWMIAFGIKLFGAGDAFGWRFSAALVGTISVLMLARIARRLFSSSLLGTVAGLLLAVDGEHLVLSRTGLLDIFVMFFALAAFGCLVLDRDSMRRKLALRLAEGWPATIPIRGRGSLGPGTGMRWWLLACGVCCGLCTGVKWSGLFFTAVFGVVAVCWAAGARKTAGVAAWEWAAAVPDGLKAFVLIVPVALITYVASWTGWFVTSGGFNRNWAAEHPGEGPQWLPAPLRSLLNYHQQMFDFNVHLSAEHPYMSNPVGWLLQWRPTAFDYTTDQTCSAANCSQAIHALGNPVIWWGGTIALVFVIYYAIRWRDWRAWAVLAGLIGGYLPWFAYMHRTIFTFYTIAFTPWMVLALTFAIGLILGPPDAKPDRRRVGAIGAGAIVVLAVLLAAFFWPVWTGESIPYDYWRIHMWLPSWP